MAASLTGLTWAHPRAWRGLEAATDDLDVRWDRQSLDGFEHEPITGLAARYHLLVVDHPGLGAAVASDALLPVDELFDAAELATWATQSVGSTWESYTLGGRTWALPLDAATQALVYRPDLLDRAPGTWTEVEELAAKQPVALCLAGPHAGLMLLAMAAERASATGRLLHPGRAAAALDLLRRLWRRVDREASALDPIGMHDLLAGTDQPVCCPLTYSYATYGGAERAHRLSWAPAPVFDAGQQGAASTLGGTGLALSVRALDRADDVRTVVRRLMEPVVQHDVVAPLGGQPAVRTVWESAPTDAAWNGHYSGTFSTLESAYIRPRHDGWIPFQDELSARVREAITTTTPAAQVVAGLEQDHARTLRRHEHQEVR
jgi:multiple sugar transport system substrate-binding protein